MIHKQRCYSLDRALIMADEYARRNSINLKLQQVATTGGFYTYLCLSDNHKLKIAFRGAGSGNVDEAKVKAIYESLEESLLYQALNVEAAQVYQFSTASCPTADTLHKQHLLPKFLLGKEFMDSPYPWIRLVDITAKEAMYYPICLMYPHSKPARIAEMANSTGIAMGATKAEAIIHGLNDWIERDAYGLFLLSTIMKQNQPARFVDKDSLPDDIRYAVNAIETAHHDELKIVNITTDYNIPAFLVSFTKQDVPVQPSGLGASLCKQEALWQALFEALQARDRYNKNTVMARNKTLGHYEKQPILQRAFRADLRKVPAAQENWQNIVSLNIPQHLEAQIDLINHHITSRGSKVYHGLLFQDQKGLALVYVLVLGAETFGMMREGLYLPIKKRGMESIQ